MPASLPPHPSLEWLRKTAKERLADLRAERPSARLADAQLLLARDHGFGSWRALKDHVESRPAIPQDPGEESVRTFLEHVGAGSLDDVRSMLDETPELVDAVGPHPFWGGRPQALHLAVEGKRREMFDLLLARGADPSGKNEGYDHWSPLMLAIDRGEPHLREELLRRGARVDLLEALMIEDDERVEELLGDGTLPPIRPNGGSILAFARTPYAVDRLIALGAATDAEDRWGSTPIDAMSRLGPRGRALVELLVERGIAASPREYARLGDDQTLARLVAADPSVAHRDDVMMAAVDFGHHDLVEWLLARGGNVHARATFESHHTALHSAAWNGDVRMVRVLVEAGADPSARDEQYDATPLGWAETSRGVTNNPRCEDVAKYLGGLEPRV